MVAVIYSPDFGVGWSSQVNPKCYWPYDTKCPDKSDLLFDPVMAEMIDDCRPAEEIIKYAESKWGEDGLSYSCLYDARIYWLPPGTEFIVWEYDGAESIVLAKDAVVVA